MSDRDNRVGPGPKQGGGDLDREHAPTSAAGSLSSAISQPIRNSCDGLDQDDLRGRVRVAPCRDRRQRREAAPVTCSDSPTAKRMRLYRRNRRRGYRCVPLKVGN